MAEVLHLRGPVLLGPDEVLPELWVLGGRVTYEAPSAPGQVVVTMDGWVLPGLVDAHCHVGLSSQGAVDERTTRAQAERDRDAGALLLRDAGSPADTRWVDGAPDLPRIVRAGRHLARPTRYLRHYAHEIEPEDLARCMATQAARGDGWVKIVGDWIDRSVGDLTPLWPAWALREGIAAAHAAGARVTAHVFGEDALDDLLAAGIDGLEHATGLTGPTRDSAARRAVAVVPTLVNIANFPTFADRGEQRFPVWAAHLRRLHRHRYQNVLDAYEAGVPIFVGTDAGGQLPHGLVAREIAELVTAGLSPVAALDAGCWGARSWLGRPGLQEGADADLVVYRGDPREDVATLERPRAVVLRGRLVLRDDLR